MQCAWAAQRKKDSYDKAQFHRLCKRCGKKSAICAVAASILTAICHMMRDGTEHHDPGADHFGKRPAEVKAKRWLQSLKKLGYEAELEPIAQAA